MADDRGGEVAEGSGGDAGAAAPAATTMPEGAGDKLSAAWTSFGDEFTRYWAASDTAARIRHLVMSRELLIGRLSEQEASSSIGPDPQTLFRMLCPELHESRLGRLAADETVPSLIRARLSDEATCRSVDTAFVRSNAGAAAPELIEAFATNRGSLILTFLHDVITIYAASTAGGSRSGSGDAAAAGGTTDAAATAELAAGAADADDITAAAEASSTRKPVFASAASASAHLSRVPTEAETLSLRADARAAAAAEAEGSISTTSVASTPMAQFLAWIEEAREAGAVPEEGQPMTLATATPDGFPSSRAVLLRGHDERGFVFFTNYTSRKGRELTENPNCALSFLWNDMGRQVRVEGRAERVSPEESDAYWVRRPVGSQIASIASPQSTVLPGGRDELADRVFQTTLRVHEARRAMAAAVAASGDGADGSRPAMPPIPRPEHWGGFRVIPSKVEFWVSRPSRLANRVRYVRIETDSVAPPPLPGAAASASDAATAAGWRLETLAP